MTATLIGDQRPSRVPTVIGDTASVQPHAPPFRCARPPCAPTLLFVPSSSALSGVSSFPWRRRHSAAYLSLRRRGQAWLCIHAVTIMAQSDCITQIGPELDGFSVDLDLEDLVRRLGARHGHTCQHPSPLQREQLRSPFLHVILRSDPFRDALLHVFEPRQLTLQLSRGGLRGRWGGQHRLPSAARAGTFFDATGGPRELARQRCKLTRLPVGRQSPLGSDTFICFPPNS